MTDAGLLGRLEYELREISGVILRTSMEGCEMIRRGAPLSEINTVVEFMRTLFGRREMIIHEIKRAGGSERDAVRRLAQKEDYPSACFAGTSPCTGEAIDREGGA